MFAQILACESAVACDGGLGDLAVLGPNVAVTPALDEKNAAIAIIQVVQDVAEIEQHRHVATGDQGQMELPVGRSQASSDFASSGSRTVRLSLYSEPMTSLSQVNSLRATVLLSKAFEIDPKLSDLNLARLQVGLSGDSDPGE